MLQPSAREQHAALDQRLDHGLVGVALARGAIAVEHDGGFTGRDAGFARALFERALTLAPGTARASLGLASAAMLMGDWDRASKAFWTARERGVSPQLTRAVGSAIPELQRIARPPDGPAAR